MCVSHGDSDYKASLTSSSSIVLTDMEPWLKVSLLLCIFGLLKEFRPSEPFIIEYLINPPMNFTVEEVSQDIYPYSVYSYMLSLIIVFLVTDYLRYKIVIILDAISGFIVYMMLVFCRSMFLLQVIEVIYGLFMAGEVAYYTYIYAKVDKKHFQAVTSHTRTAYLVGRSVSGVASQIIVSWHLFSYYHLQIFTAGGLAIASVWALFLPSVNNSIYFHRSGSSPRMGSFNKVSEDSGEKRETRNVFYVMLADLKHAFTNPYVLKLIAWSIIGTGGYYQVITYCQTLWEVVSNVENENKEKQMLWNGAVESSYTILGAVATFAIGKINLSWRRYSEYLLAVNSLLMAIMMYLMSQTNYLWVAYVTYIAFAIFYQATITIVNSEIAQNLKEDSYGLIFGVIMFFSLVAQTFLTAVFAGGNGFSLSPRLQFVVYGAYYNIVGFIIVLKILICAIMRLRKGREGVIQVTSTSL